MKNSNISWTHNTQNFWVGCDKVAPECAKCYIGREIRKQADWQNAMSAVRQPWGEVYLTKTWRDPYKWQTELSSNVFKRIFTCSLSDFFHARVDGQILAKRADDILPMHAEPASRCYKNWIAKCGEPFVGWWNCTWREAAWQVIRETPNLVYLILTKRPELIAARLPKDWGVGYPNVWLGTSVGCNMTLSKMDSLRKIPVHPNAVRFVSCEPLLEDISQKVNLDGFGWLIVGGESGSNPEYSWNPEGDWRAEMNSGETGRRIMEIGWAMNLLAKARTAGIPFFFKQVTAAKSGTGEDALGQQYHEFPAPPHGNWSGLETVKLVELPVLRLPERGSAPAEVLTSNRNQRDHEIRQIETAEPRAEGLASRIAVRTASRPRWMSKGIMKVIDEARKRRLITWNEKDAQPIGLLRPSHFNSKFHLTGKAPALVVSKGWVYGWWSLYAAPKTGTKGRLHGSYPRQFLERALSLFPKAKDILHVPSGTLGNLPTGHVTMDMKSDATRDPMIIGDCCKNIPFPDASFDLILSDPPYSPKDSKLYGCQPFRTMDFFREAYRVLRPGGYLGFLHLHLPQIRKPEDKKWRMRGVITITLGSHKKARAFSLWQRL